MLPDQSDTALWRAVRAAQDERDEARSDARAYLRRALAAEAKVRVISAALAADGAALDEAVDVLATASDQNLRSTEDR